MGTGPPLVSARKENSLFEFLVARKTNLQTTSSIDAILALTVTTYYTHQNMREKNDSHAEVMSDLIFKTKGTSSLGSNGSIHRTLPPTKKNECNIWAQSHDWIQSEFAIHFIIV